MPRVKRGMVSQRKHKKVLNLARGYRGSKNRLIKVAREAVLHAGSYAYQGRKNRKRTFRALWNIRIGEAVRQEGLSYSVFIHKLKQSKIELDRKILADLVVSDPMVFKQIVDEARKA